MNKEYIEREAVLKELQAEGEREGKKSYNAADNSLFDVSAKYTHGEYCYCVACEIVTDTPAADVAEVKRSEWERPILINGYWHRRCKACLYSSPCGDASNKDFKPAFCSNCGAKMEAVKI